jgi:hypothetical protein
MGNHVLTSESLVVIFAKIELAKLAIFLAMNSSFFYFVFTYFFYLVCVWSLLLCTFSFLVTLTSWGIYIKNILKVHNIVSFDKSSHRCEVVSWHPFFDCIVVVSMCFNHHYAMPWLLRYCAFISIVPSLFCHHCYALTLSCFHHYYTMVIVLEFLQLMCEIMRN